ncbi:hypothetical protein ACJX0J_036309, partial [Zea mays]
IAFPFEEPITGFACVDWENWIRDKEGQLINGPFTSSTLPPDRYSSLHGICRMLAVMINIGIGLGKNDREVSDSTLLITHIGKSQVTRKNIAFFIALSETGKNVFSDTNSSEKNNDNFNARWPFLFNALDRILVSTEWELNGDNLASSAQPEFKDSGRWSLKFGQRSMVGQKTRKEILQKLDTLDKKAETCLLSTQEDGENTSLTADFTIDETAMNRLGVKNGVIGLLILCAFEQLFFWQSDQQKKKYRLAKLLNEDGMWQQILRKKYLGNKTFGQVLMVCSNLHQNGKFSSQKWNGSKKCISLAIDLLYLWIWGLLGCRGSIKTQRQRYIRNDVAGNPFSHYLKKLFVIGTLVKNKIVLSSQVRRVASTNLPVTRHMQFTRASELLIIIPI